MVDKNVPSKAESRISLSAIFAAIGVFFMVLAIVSWGKRQLEYRHQAENNQALAQYATSEEPAQDEEASRKKLERIEHETARVTKKSESQKKTEPEKAKAKAKPKPAAPKPDQPQVDWDGLKSVNDEVVGWLRIPGTEIDYPVYQTSDNDKYLRHDATGEWSIGGQLFCDYECSAPGMVDELTLIYGHHMQDGSMFQQMAEMDDQAKFDAAETVWYVTENDVWECQPLFLYYTQPEDLSVRTFKWGSKKEFRECLRDRLGRAVTQREDADELLDSIDHVLCLITCNYYDGYGRSVLVCAPKTTEA